MKSRFLVRSEHLNHQGHLYGGDLMSEIDNIGYCLVRELHPHKAFVTRAAEIGFSRPARIGDVITFMARRGREGTTSMRIDVDGRVNDVEICRATLIYVHVGPDGRKAPIQD
jgi:acyl-CoA hydrolase